MNKDVSNMNSKILFTICIFTTTACSTSSDAQQTEIAQANKKSEVGYKCSKETVTGTLIKQKTCTTQAQRDAIRENAKKVVKDLGNSGLTKNGNL